ncbi:MAG: class IV adenylate cyclase [Candidatus Levybacteria bacterium]|nr:class IV adenylate cyclase [Candidatus Levybacteria bacterium]
MKHLNIEIKARCSNPKAILSILKSCKADFKGTDYQIDTYFKVARGRLKLREGNIENYLIYYERENKKGPKKSKIILLKTVPNSPLKNILMNALGVLVIVDKERKIYFIENVKFHVDTVKDLGTFMEIEAIDKNGNIGKDKLLIQCQKYLKLFDVKEKDLIEVSYSDLLMEKIKK